MLTNKINLKLDIQPTCFKFTDQLITGVTSFINRTIEVLDFPFGYKLFFNWRNDNAFKDIFEKQEKNLKISE